jgi:hypothetical protein
MGINKGAAVIRPFFEFSLGELPVNMDALALALAKPD